MSEQHLLDLLRRDLPCGLRVCSWCPRPRVIGLAPGLKPGQVTHGMCTPCAHALLATVNTDGAFAPLSEDLS